jgi:lipid-A-disaccharide synthase
MHLFISAGEPSGDLHGSNLIRALRQIHPTARCVGYGGDRMEAAGCLLLYPLTKLAVMWFLRVFANILLFVRLLVRADRYFKHHRPDAVVLIDYPGFHWWLARRAHARGIPVFYFVPPQLWAWAGWRVKKVRRFVDHVLCTLPFEPAWYADRGVATEYVGHPYFDELPRQKLDAAFLAEQRARPGRIIALLPGSRNQEVVRNFATMLRAAGRICREQPGVRFLVASYNARQAEMVREMTAGSSLPIEAHVGRTPEAIELAEACVAVSGSVGLELLYREKPTAVLYRIGKLDLTVSKFFRKCRFISLVNLLADRELFPEYLTDRCEAEAIAGHLLRWLTDPAAMAEAKQRLAELKARAAVPGACDRAARIIVDRLRERSGDVRRAA